MSVERAKLLDRLGGGLLLRSLAPLRLARDLFGSERELRAVREIALVKFWGVGNAALLLPVIHMLKERHPAARLTVVTLEANRPVFDGAADRVLGVRMHPLPAAARDLLGALAVLRRSRPDLALDAEQFVRVSQALLFLSGARQVIAFDPVGPDRAALADVRVPYEDRRHMAEAFLDLARAAGVRHRRYRPGGLRVDPAAAARVGELLRAGGERPLAVLHPGSGDNFPGRRWPTRRFGLVARRLARAGARVVVTGTRAEAALAREVAEASEGAAQDWSGSLDLRELIALLARAAVLVANDTGPVHLASALGTPVVGLYGPNTPRIYGPLAEGSVAFYDAPPCSPCITNFNYKTSRCLNPVCIRALPVDGVAEAALRLLARGAARRREWGA